MILPSDQNNHLFSLCAPHGVLLYNQQLACFSGPRPTPYAAPRGNRCSFASADNAGTRPTPLSVRSRQFTFFEKSPNLNVESGGDLFNGYQTQSFPSSRLNILVVLRP
jgi:hypothetical protein